MNKVNLSLACPYCFGEGRNIVSRKIDTIEKEEREDREIINIKRVYNCHCNRCGNDYNVDYGSGILVKYKQFIYACNDDVKLYVDYDSQFDRSYQIVDINDQPMIIMDDDCYPILIDSDTKKEMINDHEKAKVYTYNTWMTRHR